MDYNMPVMDGFEATKMMREHLDEEGIPRGDQPIIMG